MKLTFERLGYLYRIKFSYSEDKKKHRIVTCQLEVETNKRWAGTAFIGVAKTHEKDRFVKEEGRRLALARALKTMEREGRARAWASYWARGVDQSTPVAVMQNAIAQSQLGVVLH